MTFVKRKINKNHQNLFNYFRRHRERALGYQFPALATLIYVDSENISLPTGQWSAVSSTVLKRGSQKCQHSIFVDSSNLEESKALSRCLRL